MTPAVPRVVQTSSFSTDFTPVPKAAQGSKPKRLFRLMNGVVSAPKSSYSLWKCLVLGRKQPRSLATSALSRVRPCTAKAGLQLGNTPGIFPKTTRTCAGIGTQRRARSHTTHPGMDPLNQPVPQQETARGHQGPGFLEPAAGDDQLSGGRKNGPRSRMRRNGVAGWWAERLSDTRPSRTDTTVGQNNVGCPNSLSLAGQLQSERSTATESNNVAIEPRRTQRISV